MFGFRIIRPRVLTLLAFGAIVSLAVSGFAAANTVPASSAGDGSGAITGYVVSNIQYVLDVADPAKIATVKFDLAPAAATAVSIQLAGSWYTCTNVAGAVSCTTPLATALSVVSLRVVAAS